MYKRFHRKRRKLQFLSSLRDLTRLHLLQVQVTLISKLNLINPSRVKKITGMKKAMTKTMTEALTIPFFTFSDEMDASKLFKLRKEMK